MKLSMRRLASIAAFALFLAVPLWAQHGGGHGGGHAGGFSGHGGGHAAFSGGSHFSGGGFSHGFSTHSGFSSRGMGAFHSNRITIRNSFPGRRGFGSWNRFGWGYPWGAYYGYYDPYWYWDDHSRFDQEYANDYDRAQQMNDQSLREQQMRRQEEADGDQDAYALPPRRAAESTDDSHASPIMPATVLVFRDQHKQEVQNYAIVGQTLWSFAPQHTQKISLSDLDLQATTKANEDQGVTFRVPATNEAQ